MRQIDSFLAGAWHAPGGKLREVADAVTSAPFAVASGEGPDAVILDHARKVGGPAMRAGTFHDRARRIKALALHLDQHKDQLYRLSHHMGATLSDAKIDIDGGIATLFVYASKGRREMPDAQVYRDGAVEQLSRQGTFLGQHICVPKQGVALHINAFNFPVWGMLEKLGATLLAGVPAIVKPATASAYITEECVRQMLASGLLPEGSLQLVSGSLGSLIDGLGAQDVVSFTGSAATARQLRSHPAFTERGALFIAEQDSLNATVLGPDAVPGSPEFDLCAREITREMTAKAGQKCTAIRRVMVPEAHAEAMIDAVRARLSKVTLGAPDRDDVRMGALVSAAQKRDVLETLATLETEATRVIGDPANFDLLGADPEAGAFVPPILLHCADPDIATRIHDTEAFGPVATLMVYSDLAHATQLVNRGGGSLVTSVFTRDGKVAQQTVAESAAWNGRLYFMNHDAAEEATGHGSPLPHMVHGGPGRAGGGEELGGIRGVMHYMQRTAVQGSPDILSAIGGVHVTGAKTHHGPQHPFRRTFTELEIGETLVTPSRTITLEDIEHFATFTGDTFYAHMDEAAAARNPFFPGRVAHGYLLLSFAAGLFVDPDEGPVLANTGLDNLRFMKPAPAGTELTVHLTVMAKTPRTEEYGEVRWAVSLRDQEGDLLATYELLTMVRV
ncbi:phenylacetic acid degradation bifunctional protein PaaZ [Pseudaestuariivita sp.]|uniref:phenylacetic acid degradation bifunctional protein PaaZ n=1 Tax=Pseudaestuariivita sp. TaxID=2211669 RepID=UPI00405A0EFB